MEVCFVADISGDVCRCCRRGARDAQRAKTLSKWIKWTNGSGACQEAAPAHARDAVPAVALDRAAEDLRARSGLT